MTIYAFAMMSIDDLIRQYPIVFIVLSLFLLLGLVFACVLGWFSLDIEARLKRR